MALLVIGGSEAPTRVEAAGRFAPMVCATLPLGIGPFVWRWYGRRRAAVAE